MTTEALIARLQRSLKTDGVPLLTHETAEIIAKLRAAEELAAEAECAERDFCRKHREAHGVDAVPPEFGGVSVTLRRYRAAGDTSADKLPREVPNDVTC